MKEIITTKDQKELKSHKGMGKKGLAALTIALSGAGVFGLTGCGTNTEATDPSNTPAATETSASAEPSVEPSQGWIQNPVARHNDDIKLAAPEIQEMDTMSVDEFNALPQEQRLEYVSWLNRYLDEDFDYLQQKSEGMDDAISGKPVTPSPDNTGEEIFNYYQYCKSEPLLSYATVKNPTEADRPNLWILDKDRALKALSGCYDVISNDGTNRAISNAYQDDVDHINRLDKLTLPYSESYLYSEGEKYQVVESDGNSYWHKNVGIGYPPVEGQYDDSQYLSTDFVYREYTSYDGAPTGAWLYVVSKLEPKVK